MADHNKYTPILKARAGEIRAISELKPQTMTFTTPLIEIPSVPWDFEDEQPAVQEDIHLEKVTTRITRDWPQDLPAWCDCCYTSNNLVNGHHSIYYCCDQLEKAKIAATPVTGPNRTPEYNLGVKDLHKTYKRGAVLRLTTEDLDDDDLKKTIDTLLQTIDIPQESTDIVIDLSYFPPDATGSLGMAIKQAINSLPYLHDWRTLTVAGTSFSKDLSAFRANNIGRLRRGEWSLWRTLVTSSIKRKPAFGDYAIQHPDPDEIDPRIMNPSASIRYTHDDEWIIFRGSGLKLGGYQQFPTLCKQIIQAQEYSGANFSSGDKCINDCANGTTGPGNLATWKFVGANHHVDFVAGQVANHP